MQQRLTTLFTKDTLYCVCAIIVFTVTTLFLFRSAQKMLHPTHDRHGEEAVEFTPEQTRLAHSSYIDLMNIAPAFTKLMYLKQLRCI